MATHNDQPGPICKHCLWYWSIIIRWQKMSHASWQLINNHYQAMTIIYHHYIPSLAIITHHYLCNDAIANHFSPLSTATNHCFPLLVTISTGYVYLIGWLLSATYHFWPILTSIGQLLNHTIRNHLQPVTMIHQLKQRPQSWTINIHSLAIHEPLSNHQLTMTKVYNHQVSRSLTSGFTINLTN